MSKENKNIPIVNIYGDNPNVLIPDLLHSENLTKGTGLFKGKIKPHRHSNLTQMLYLKTGSGTVFLDGESKDLHAPCIVVVAEMSIHSFNFTADSTGFVLSIASPLCRKFLKKLNEHQRILSSSGYFKVPDYDEDINYMFQKINNEYNDEQLGKELILESLTTTLLACLIRLNFINEPNVKLKLNKGEKHFSSYLKYIEQQYNQHQSIEVYAKKLGITSPYLNLLCQQFAQKTALQLIHERLFLEAKRKLIYTALTISKISDELGFSEPAYFTRFFTRLSKTSPRDFRRESGTF